VAAEDADAPGATAANEQPRAQAASVRGIFPLPRAVLAGAPGLGGGGEALSAKAALEGRKVPNLLSSLLLSSLELSDTTIYEP